jgi:hypothetical protein
VVLYIALSRSKQEAVILLMGEMEYPEKTSGLRQITDKLYREVYLGNSNIIEDDFKPIFVTIRNQIARLCIVHQ